MTYNKSAPNSIKKMFASLAKNYDKTNTLCSLGIHKTWNRALVDSLENATLLLDLCSGTGDIAFRFLKKNTHSKAILLDFCEEMLNVAKVKGAIYKERFTLMNGDAQNILLEDNTVDAVTLSYGIRNVQDPQKCFHEVFRVLKKGKVFAILELTRPSFPLLRKFHQIYLQKCLPLMGKISTQNKEAYCYLANSISTFIEPGILENQLAIAGFKKIKRTSFMGGIATLIVCHN